MAVRSSWVAVAFASYPFRTFDDCEAVFGHSVALVAAVAVEQQRQQLQRLLDSDGSCCFGDPSWWLLWAREARALVEAVGLRSTVAAAVGLDSAGLEMDRCCSSSSSSFAADVVAAAVA